MPPKPRLRQYREPMMPIGELHPDIKLYLLEGKHPPSDAPDELRNIPYQPARAEKLWRSHKRELLAEGRRRGFSPFAMDLFESKSLPGLPAWRWHCADPRPTLMGQPATACVHCLSRDTTMTACLSK
jgi:hypothetical protein